MMTEDAIAKAAQTLISGRAAAVFGDAWARGMLLCERDRLRKVPVFGTTRSLMQAVTGLGSLRCRWPQAMTACKPPMSPPSQGRSRSVVRDASVEPPRCWRRSGIADVCPFVLPSSSAADAARGHRIVLANGAICCMSVMFAIYRAQRRKATCSWWSARTSAFGSRT